MKKLNKILLTLAFVLMLTIPFTIVGCQFNVNKYTITLRTNNTNYGSVYGDGEYFEGQKITVAAVPNDGYEFVNWTIIGGDEVYSSEVAPSITVSENVYLKANFKSKPVRYALDSLRVQFFDCPQFEYATPNVLSPTSIPVQRVYADGNNTNNYFKIYSNYSLTNVFYSNQKVNIRFYMTYKLSGGNDLYTGVYDLEYDFYDDESVSPYFVENITDPNGTHIQLRFDFIKN